MSRPSGREGSWEGTARTPVSLPNPDRDDANLPVAFRLSLTGTARRRGVGSGVEGRCDAEVRIHLKPPLLREIAHSWGTRQGVIY
jgi:hypothetical protein